jgi:small subunit ribosomal protein S2
MAEKKDAALVAELENNSNISEGVVSMRQLLEAGVHFGHQTKRWDPRMKKYIYTARNDIHVINLQKSLAMLNVAYEFVKGKVADGHKVLFVGTKKQAQEAVSEEANKAGMYFVNQRWLGGMLTNLETIRRSVRRLRKIEAMKADGTFDKLPTKEVAKLNKEKTKLDYNLSGILEMKKTPGVLFVVDTIREHIAIREARKLHIPIVAMVDTNSNPDVIDYPVPSNDDAIRAIKLITEAISKACIEGNKIFIEKSGGKISDTVEEMEETIKAAERIETEEMISEKEQVDKTVKPVKE